VVALSFASGRSRCHQHPKAGPGRASGALEAAVTTLILAVVFLGQEIGRRGFLPLRLCELMPGRRAAVLTGACDAIFHVPLLTLTTTYQYAGSRWIVAPTVTATHRRSHRCRNRLSSIRCYATVDRRRSVRGSSCGNKSAVMILDQYGHLFADRLDIVADAMDAARAEALAGVYASCTDAEVVQLRS
jgi:hypothetical protein